MNRLKVLVSAYACNPMSSLQLHPGEDITGWRIVEQISRFHDVSVITHSYNRDGVDQALQKRPLSGVRFYFLDLPAWMRILYKIEFAQRIYYYLWQIKAWRFARVLHRQVRFDLAHHVTFGNDWIPSFIGALLPVPFIHGPVGGGQKTPKLLRKEYTLYGRFAETVRNVVQWFGRKDYFRRRCLRRARAILVCNRETRAKIPAKYSGKIFGFPVNGISTDEIRLNFSRPPSGELFRVLTAGRMHRLKGFALAIRAFALFVRTHPESEFVIIGKGPEESRLRRLIRELELAHQVRMIPWLPREKLLHAMFASHVMVFPSFRDGGGAVVVEAMAVGKPVVCLDSGGPGFHVQPEWGIKIRPGKPDVVAEEISIALERLSGNKELRESLGRAARKRVEEFYLWEKLGERLQEIYRLALDADLN
ncbi:MAG: glycosyltransferase [Candidatus Aminicenantales bacterium]